MNGNQGIATALTVLAVAGIVLGTTLAGSAEPPAAGGGNGNAPTRSTPQVYTKWPFDSQEARRRQEETAAALGVPVETKVDLDDNVTMEFVLIPAGEFMMGSRDSAEEVARKTNPITARAEWFQDEHPQHLVRITKPFYIGKYEVTQEQWAVLMGKSRSTFMGAIKPVEQISWDNCQDYIKALNKLEKGVFRLPTEAEWEYACRAGTTTPFYFGETISTEQANYNSNYAYGDGRRGINYAETTGVGSFSPNAFGLCDMHGNVWEWCEDWYAEDYYKESPTADPRGPESGGARVLRGGAWSYFARDLRSANRFWYPPTFQISSAGFRLVLLPRESKR